MKLDQTTFVAPSFQPLQQHPHFGQALAGMGRPMTSYALPAGGTAQVFTRRVWPFRRSLKMISRGPYWPEPPSEKHQYDALCILRAQNVRLINAEDMPAHLLKAAGYRQIMTPASIAVMDLRHGPDVRRALMSIKWRNALRKAETADLRISMRSYQHTTDKWLLDEDEKQQSARGYRALPSAVTQAYSVMNKGQAIIVTASRVAVPIAAMIFLRHGASATYHIGWTSPEGRACNAHNLCLVKAMDALESFGTQVLDMGTLDTAASPGVARFKLGSGAQAKPLGGTWLRLACFRKHPFT